MGSTNHMDESSTFNEDAVEFINQRVDRSVQFTIPSA